MATETKLRQLAQGGCPVYYFYSSERYLAANLANPSAALHFMDEFDRQIEAVCENPCMHALSRMPELAALGYRPFFVNSYVALYTVRENVVVVAHVFHQSQDYARLALQRPEN